MQFRHNSRVLYGLVLALLLSHSANAQGFKKCGVQRWDVKTMSDADAERVMMHKVVKTTVKRQAQLKTPFGLWPTDGERDVSEDTLYEITAYAVGWKVEEGKSGDKDIHLVLQDLNSKHTMVVEVPDTRCPGAKASNYAAEFDKAYYWIEENLDYSSNFWIDKVKVRVKGIGFWDKPGHKDKNGKWKGHEKGSAINGRELHPLISIEFAE